MTYYADTILIIPCCAKVYNFRKSSNDIGVHIAFHANYRLNPHPVTCIQ